MISTHDVEVIIELIRYNFNYKKWSTLDLVITLYRISNSLSAYYRNDLAESTSLLVTTVIKQFGNSSFIQKSDHNYQKKTNWIIIYTHLYENMFPATKNLDSQFAMQTFSSHSVDLAYRCTIHSSIKGLQQRKVQYKIWMGLRFTDLFVS